MTGKQNQHSTSNAPLCSTLIGWYMWGRNGLCCGLWCGDAGRIWGWNVCKSGSVTYECKVIWMKCSGAVNRTSGGMLCFLLVTLGIIPVPRYVYIYDDQSDVGRLCIGGITLPQYIWISQYGALLSNRLGSFKCGLQRNIRCDCCLMIEQTIHMYCSRKGCPTVGEHCPTQCSQSWKSR